MKIYAVLLLSTLAASIGQVFFKLSKFNIWGYELYVGFLAYFLGALLWVYALKFYPLSKVYPFTFLTFVMVMCFSVVIFKEKIGITGIIGSIFIIIGIVLINM